MTAWIKNMQRNALKMLSEFVPEMIIILFDYEKKDK